MPSSSTPTTGNSLQPARRWPWALALAAIIVLATLGNLLWLQANQILVGRDASGYLLTTLEYRDFLSPLSWQAIFQAFVHPPYRTPALFIAAQPFLAISGAPADSAQLLNVLLHALAILLTWLLARTLTSRWTALLAAVLIASLPQMAAMARLFYTEMFLTVTVALNLLALYRSRNFTARGWSLLWGASAGVGLLVKWTFPIYIALPLLIVLWRARHALLPAIWWKPRALAIAALAGALFVALWWLPNRQLADALPAGNWAAPGWLLLVGGFVYALLSGQPANRWFPAAALLVASIASLWYLPHADFATTLFVTDMERGSNPLGPLDWKSYGEYIEYLYQQHFGALLFWIAIPLAALPWIVHLLRARRSLNPSANLLWWSLLSALIVLTQISQRNPRNLVPLLPQIAILIALGIAAWPRLPRTLLAAATVAALMAQWTVITFNGASPLHSAARPLWAIDEYALPPASGRTAAGYNIAPEILQAITGTAPEGTAQSLGMLVNADYLHRGSLRYLAHAQGAPIEITGLTEEDARWQSLLDSQWILHKDGDNNNAEAAALALIQRIAAGDPLFQQLYAPVREWHLPNGETITLHRRTGPGFPRADTLQLAAAQELATALFANSTPAATILYGSPNLAVWLGRFDPPGSPRVLSDAWQDDALAEIEGPHGTVAAVLNSNTEALEAWLDAHAVRAATFTPAPQDDDPADESDFALVFYGFTDEDALGEIDVALTANAPEIALQSLRSLHEVAPGGVLLLETRFAADAPGIKWSVRLVDAAGNVLAANDRAILAQDRFGLLVPVNTPAGNYQIVARLYNEATLEPILAAQGREETRLFEVQVR